MKARRPAVLVFLACLSVVVTACGPGAATPLPASSATPAPTPRPPDVPLATPPPVTNVPPAILEAVQAEAARVAAVPEDQLTLVRANPITWPDGSLGCPKPGEMYTMALVDGYWIVFEAAGETYDYRVTEDGSFTRCELPALRE